MICLVIITTFMLLLVSSFTELQAQANADVATATP